jgi:hypothetical protein
MVTAGLPDDKASTRERRWPVGAALLTAWLLPATTAKRTRHASLNKIWSLHFITALATATTIFLLVAWNEAGGRFDAWGAQIRGVFNRFSRDFVSAPVEFVLAATALTLLMELAYTVLAAIVMPWGARDEPLRKSYRSALCSTFLSSIHILVIVVVFGTVVVASQGLKQNWMIGHGLIKAENIPLAPVPPSMSSHDPGYSKALAAYQAKVQQHQRSLAVIQRIYDLSKLPKPFYVENREPLLVTLGGVMALWLLWVLLRSVGARREVTPIARPPTCEACGYNLTAIPLESRCPECGMVVSASLGPDVRPGTAWQSRATMGTVWAWCKTTFTAIQRPDELGRQLLIVEPGNDHRRFMALHLPIVFGVGFLMLLIFALLSAPDDSFGAKLPRFLMVMAVFGMACVGGMVVFSLLAAATIGTFESFRYQRNLLPAAMQIACYLAPYLTMWAVFGGATGLGVFWAEDAYVFRGLQDITGVFHETLAVATWLVPNVACCIWFFLLLYRGTIGAAYANR